MTNTLTYRPHKVRCEDRDDGTIIMHSDYALGAPVSSTNDWLHRWAKQRPDAVFLAERSGAGWRTLTYSAALEQVRALAAGLLGRGLNGDTPILILSGNGVDHGLLALAAQYVGIPHVPVAEQYSTIPGAQKQLSYILDLIRPAMIFAEDGEKFAASLSMPQMQGLDIVVSRNAAPGMTCFDDLTTGGTQDVDAAAALVGPDTIAKILMTSGSTSHPKGVLTTQGMMCANQQMYAEILPLLAARPPRLVDWLPWNHVFGGSNNFNQMLANGGALYIDGGKPVKGLIAKTFENNLLMNGTIAYNVPVGFALLRDEMRSNQALKQRYFQDLDMIFYAGASLPQDVWQDLMQMAAEVRDEPPLMTTCWGMTETAPACIFLQEPSDMAGVIGVPLPGVSAKLVPDGGARYELRVKGANITPGYFRDPDKTAAAFDDEGYFRTGDALTLVDPADRNRGLRFDGRLSEDFKLTTGTWVRGATLRLEMLGLLAPLAADVVVTGEGHSEVGLLILPAGGLLSDGRLTADGAACLGDAVLADISRRLADKAMTAQGSSNKVVRALILSEPPSMADGEITAKGNLNFRKLLDRRADALTRLYDDSDPAVIRI
ncbi:MAG: feruloyl-CoA synthetase [Rhodobacteraceae bacterium]|nr:MAG: feruloyl-CoA synthetase [Paracoccaceae bacterium]